MGNKRRTLLERKSRDPRTKKRRCNRKRNENESETVQESSFDGEESQLVADESELVPAEEESELVVPAEEESQQLLLPEGEVDKYTLCASERKIKSTPVANNDDTYQDNGYLFMEITMLFPVIEELVKCPKCGYCVETLLLHDGRQGLANPIQISCRSLCCRWAYVFYSSPLVGEGGRGPKPFDINIRSQIAFREIGRGHDAIETFCGYMNMPAPSDKGGFSNITTKLLPKYKEVIVENMQDAANDIRQKPETDGNDDAEVGDVDFAMEDDDTVSLDNVIDTAVSANDRVVDTAVSVDGSWQRRGYASLNGLVTAISINNGKCLSYECLVKKCKACQIWEGKKHTDRAAYDNYIKKHVCPINHEGSAAAMETEGALRIFNNSERDLKLCFTTYIGDGDSKAYPAVSRAEPYGPEKPVIKGECIGHVQKRVGTRLRRYKKENSKKVLSDKKKLGGAGRLTDKSINRLQNYYGLAIRQNCDDLTKMRRAVGAVLYHCSDANDSAARHMFCDPASEWCKFRIAEREGTDYIDKPGLPVAVRDEIKHVFQDLSSEALLKKCLHGFTQNNNECLNGLIWKRLPKDIYVGSKIFHIGVASAIMSFNSGANELCKVMEKLEMTPGNFTRMFCEEKDMSRIDNMKQKSSDKGKKERKRKRAIRKGFHDTHEAIEGDVYGAGEF